MRIELLLVQPASAVNARELRVLLVAPPIGTRDAHQFERLRIELARARQVRPATHVEPVVARPVDRQFLVFGQFLRPLGLEGLALGFPLLDQLLAAPDLAAQRLVGLDDPPHLFLDRGEVVHAEGVAALGRFHIVIEAIVGRGTEGDLRARPERLHCLGEDMGKIVPCQFERVVLIAIGHQRQLGIAFKRPVDIAQFAIDTRRDRRLGEAGADRRRHIRRGRAGFHLAHRSIGQADLEQFGHVTRRPSGCRAHGTSGRSLEAAFSRMDRYGPGGSISGETPTARYRAAVDRLSRDRPPPVARGGGSGREARLRHDWRNSDCSEILNPRRAFGYPPWQKRDAWRKRLPLSRARSTGSGIRSSPPAE